MSADSSDDETTALHGCHAGVALVHKAQDTGDWRPVVEWLVRHPECFAEVASAIGADDETRRAFSPPPAAARPGAVLGNYELGAEIGRGQMGVVYRAFEPALNRAVAVKVVHVAGLSDKARSEVRFEAEAQAKLNDLNVVSIFGFGENETHLYFAMELLPQSLANYLASRGQGRALPPREGAELVRDIAQGVHQAHRHKLIHRDLKPANILLDEKGIPKVADFGLARFADQTVTSIAGTFAYMAPEQARGDAELTFAVDVHALGAILFELLTGRKPFGGGDVHSVRRKVIEEPAPRVRKFAPDVPRDLEWICARCLRKEPGERYTSAQALAADLSKYLHGEPIPENRGWVWDTVARAIQKRRETLAMGSWRVAFWGAASTALAMTVMQIAVLLNAPLWVSQATIAYYLLAWLGLMWGFLVAQRDSLNPVERASTAIHFGAKFSCVAILPVQMWLHDGNPVYALPVFMVLVGLATFVHGVLYWGRLYLSGLSFFAVAAAMPLVPVAYWPAVYGALLTALQILMGFHLRRVHKQAQTAPPG